MSDNDDHPQVESSHQGAADEGSANGAANARGGNTTNSTDKTPKNNRKGGIELTPVESLLFFNIVRFNKDPSAVDWNEVRYRQIQKKYNLEGLTPSGKTGGTKRKALGNTTLSAVVEDKNDEDDDSTGETPSRKAPPRKRVAPANVRTKKDDGQQVKEQASDAGGETQGGGVFTNKDCKIKTESSNGGGANPLSGAHMVVNMAPPPPPQQQQQQQQDHVRAFNNSRGLDLVHYSMMHQHARPTPQMSQQQLAHLQQLQMQQRQQEMHAASMGQSSQQYFQGSPFAFHPGYHMVGGHSSRQQAVPTTQYIGSPRSQTAQAAQGQVFVQTAAATASRAGAPKSELQDNDDPAGFFGPPTPTLNPGKLNDSPAQGMQDEVDKGVVGGVKKEE